MGKFKAQAEAITQDFTRIFNRAIRLSLRAGIAAAMHETKQDSSNAANHWMIAESSKSRPGNRRLGQVRDLRQTRGIRGPARPKSEAIGFRGDKGKNRYASLNHVRTRETEEVINKYVAGRNPSGKFYFFNALYEERSSELTSEDLKTYLDNLDGTLESAGFAAVTASNEAFQRYYTTGQRRKT